uniref:G_PROTEIN_RECEP_F1_2 domain-containing protein n=1 Tax=Parastrongyloides trichosuri TaxID=131310 RepID=A0A0N4ZW13_PARTI
MVNVLYFWLSEETEEFVYEIIIMTESIISIISNLISFVIFYLKPPPKEDMLTSLLKWTRLVDIILPLTSGILLKGRVLFPFLGCAANGICNGYPDLCKASVSLFVISIFCLIGYISIAYIFRYNIFVRKTKALHTNIIEKLAIFFFLGVAPIFSVFLFQNYPIDNPYELKEIKDVSKGLFNVKIFFSFH